jgi:hypothetical protein
MTDTAPGPSADFDFSRLQIDQATARFDLPQVSPGAFLVVRPANESNRPFQSASLARASKRQRMKVLSTDTTAEDARLDRDDDRATYPQHIVVGWGGIKNRHGAAVPFSPENVAAFLLALPNWIFDKVRLFCLRPENFLRDETPGDAETVAKN